MMKNRVFVQGVQGLCMDLCRHFRPCAGCAGSFTHTRTRRNRTAITPHKRTHMRICTLHTLHTLHMLDSYTYFHASPCTHACTPCTDTLAHAPDSLIYSFKGKKMEETAQPTELQAIRTIRCTPDNAREMQQMVKHWPELNALVLHLQEQNLFPGLRALTVTLTGPQTQVSRGIGALPPQNAAKRD